MIALSIVVEIVALVLFVLAAVGVSVRRVNLVAAGLALWLFAELLRSGRLQTG